MTKPVKKPTQLPPGRRYLARRVIVDGEERGLSVVTIDARGGVTVEPFERETHSTVMVDGTIVVITPATAFINS